jgi:hypothetical protein
MEPRAALLSGGVAEQRVLDEALGGHRFLPFLRVGERGHIQPVQGAGQFSGHESFLPLPSLPRRDLRRGFTSTRTDDEGLWWQVSPADSGVACCYQKGFWNLRRPVTAIPLAGMDGNPKTAAEPGWLPLLVTPPLPEYSSGHGCDTGSRMSLHRHFFGRDDTTFSGFSADSGTTRQFTSFSQALTELIGARV